MKIEKKYRKAKGWGCLRKEQQKFGREFWALFFGKKHLYLPLQERLDIIAFLTAK